MDVIDEQLSMAIGQISLSAIIGSLSYALDLTEGLPAGHSLRSCWIGMHVGQQWQTP